MRSPSSSPAPQATRVYPSLACGPHTPPQQACQRRSPYPTKFTAGMRRAFSHCAAGTLPSHPYGCMGNRLPRQCSPGLQGYSQLGHSQNVLTYLPSAVAGDPQQLPRCQPVSLRRLPATVPESHAPARRIAQHIAAAAGHACWYTCARYHGIDSQAGHIPAASIGQSSRSFWSPHRHCLPV